MSLNCIYFYNLMLTETLINIFRADFIHIINFFFFFVKRVNWF